MRNKFLVFTITLFCFLIFGGICFSDEKIPTKDEALEILKDLAPDLKILDPACGRGAFLFVIKNKLLQAGHSEKHIVENMLYGVDIAQQNVDVTIAVLDPGYKYKNNIECNDALTKDYKNMKFDVIVGNPPYSVGNTGQGGTAIYHKFGELALKFADIVALITPGSFIDQKKYRSFRDALNKHGLVSITSINLNTFDASIERPVWWLAKKGAARTVENLTETPSKILLSKLMALAERNHFNTKSGQADVDTSPHVNQQQTHTHTFKYITRVLKTGPDVQWCTAKLAKPLSGSLHLAVFAQRAGTELKMFFIENANEHAYSQNVCVFGVNNKSEFLNLKIYMSSNVAKFILYHASAGKNTKKGMPRALTAGKLRWIPAVDLSRSWTDEELYKHFNLTEEEIKLIEETVNDNSKNKRTNQTNR